MTLDELRALATNTRNGFACWPAPYQMSVTLEDAEFLYALVRVTKPLDVLELGTGMGVAARFIAEALKVNGNAKLATVEPRDDLREAAQGLLANLPVGVFESEELVWPERFELVFIDSGPADRAGDIDEWLGAEYQSADYRPLVLVHDANREYEGLKQGVGVFLPGSDGLWLGRAAG